MQEEIATFAGGCFWCMEHPFDSLPGVKSVTVGYTGGSTENPTYEEVGSGRTGHAEAFQVRYDPSQISYPQLLEVFWHNIDPTTKDGQFCDLGKQYRTAIFTHNSEQQVQAEASKKALKFKHVETEIVPATTFYPAEQYHQQYYKKNPFRYELYRTGSGRDSKLKQLWHD